MGSDFLIASSPVNGGRSVVKGALLEGHLGFYCAFRRKFGFEPFVIGLLIIIESIVIIKVIIIIKLKCSLLGFNWSFDELAPVYACVFGLHHSQLSLPFLVATITTADSSFFT